MRRFWRGLRPDVLLWELSLVAWLLLGSYLLSADGHLDWTGHALGRDFVNYWTGGHLVREGRIADIFHPDAFLGHEHRLFDDRLPFHFWSYPPPALFLVTPLGFTSYFAGLALWSLAGLAALFPALRLWARSSGFGVAGAEGAWRWALWLVLLAPAVSTNIALGQNGAFTAALMIGGLMLMERRPAWAGVLFGLLIFKPQLGMLLPVAVLAGRRWRVLVSAALTGTVVVAASALVFGLDAWRGFLGPTLHMQTLMLKQGHGPFQWMMPSAYMAARVLGLGSSWSMAVQAPFTVLAVVMVWRVWSGDGGGRAPSTTLRMVPLPRFAGEEKSAAQLLPRLTGERDREAVEGARHRQMLGDPDLALRAAVVMMATFVASPQAFNYDLIPASAAAVVLWRCDRSAVGRGLSLAVWASPVLMIALQAVHVAVMPIVLTGAMLRLAGLKGQSDSRDLSASNTGEVASNT